MRKEGKVITVEKVLKIFPCRLPDRFNLITDNFIYGLNLSLISSMVGLYIPPYEGNAFIFSDIKEDLYLTFDDKIIRPGDQIPSEKAILLEQEKKKIYVPSTHGSIG